jgi:predicted PhzF superfamily epimerase YddE/YHI9
VSQGREIGRDARLELRLDGDRQVWVGGRCQPVIAGTLAW